ncbi:hypothetical protein [Gordonia sp. NPDC003422]
MTDREQWVDRLCTALEEFRASSQSTEQLAALAVQIETLNGTHGQPQRPKLYLV